MEEKKKKRTQKTTGKKPVKKNRREKNAVPNNEPFKEKAKRFLMSYSFLYTMFAFLLVLVIFLFVVATIKENEQKAKQSNIVFSIMEEKTKNYIDLELQTLVGHEYSMKITNHRKGKLNTKGSTYTLTITNNSDAEIIIHQDDNTENLMTDQNQTIIQGVPFSKTKKEETIFYFTVKENSQLKEGDKLHIEVAS